MATPTYTLWHIILLTVLSFTVSLPLGDSKSLRLYKTKTKDGADLWCYPVNCTSPFERCSVNGTHDRCVPCEEGYFFVDNISSDDWRGSSPVCLSKVKECEHECADLAILVNKEECGITERAECACDLTKAFGTDPNLCEKYDGRCDVPNKQLTMNGECQVCPSGTEKLAANNSRCVPKQTVLPTILQSMTNSTNHIVETESNKLPPTTAVDTTTPKPNANNTHASIVDIGDYKGRNSLTGGQIVGIIVVVIFVVGVMIAIPWCYQNGNLNGVLCFMVNASAAGNGTDQNTLIPNGQAQNGHIPNGQAQNGHIPNGQAQNGQIPNGQAQNGQIPNDLPNGYQQNGQIPNGQDQNGLTPNGLSNGYQQNGQIPNGQDQNGLIPNGHPNGYQQNGQIPNCQDQNGVIPNCLPNGYQQNGQIPNGLSNGYQQNGQIPNGQDQNGLILNDLPNGYQQNGQIPNDQAQNGHLPHYGNDDGQDFGAILEHVTVYSDEDPQNSGLVPPHPEDLSLTIEGATGEEEEERNTLLVTSLDEPESGETFAMELLSSPVNNV